MPLLEDITEVLSFAAFRPDPDDSLISWKDRTVGRRSLLININRANASWRAVNKRGRFQEAGSQDGEFQEIANGRVEEWRGLTDGGWCAVSLNNRFIISLENNLSRRENYLELLRTNPKAVLGAKIRPWQTLPRFLSSSRYHPPPSSCACDDAAGEVRQEDSPAR